MDMNKGDVLVIINNVNVDKSDGWDKLLIRMIKLSTFPLKWIFNSLLLEDVLPENWK